MIKELRVLGSAVIASVLIAFPAVAKDAGLPGIDLQTICRSRAKALGETLGDRSKTDELYAGCLKSEQESKTALLAAWKDIPERHRASCIKPRDYAASYMEWISCLELVIDMKGLGHEKTDVEMAARPAR
jgi:hypothetical protein